MGFEGVGFGVAGSGFVSGAGVVSGGRVAGPTAFTGCIMSVSMFIYRKGKLPFVRNVMQQEALG